VTPHRDDEPPALSRFSVAASEQFSLSTVRILVFLAVVHIDLMTRAEALPHRRDVHTVQCFAEKKGLRAIASDVPLLRRRQSLC